MDAATWLKQMGDQSGQTDKRARLAELLTYIGSVPPWMTSCSRPPIASAHS
jgi:hypothetical protein